MGIFVKCCKERSLIQSTPTGEISQVINTHVDEIMKPCSFCTLHLYIFSRCLCPLLLLICGFPANLFMSRLGAQLL